MKTGRLKELLEEQELFDGEFTEEDKRLYEVLFNELNEEPTIEIPFNFADQVTQKIIRKSMIRENIKVYALVSSIFLAFIAICVIAFGFDTTAAGQRNQSFLVQNLPLFALGAVVYFVVQTLDRIFVKRYS